MNTPDPVEQSQAAVQLCQSRLADLERAAELLRVELPRARAALASARARRQKLVAADTARRQAQRRNEIEQLQKQIEVARHV